MSNMPLKRKYAAVKIIMSLGEFCTGGCGLRCKMAGLTDQLIFLAALAHSGHDAPSIPKVVQLAYQHQNHHAHSQWEE